VGISSGPGALSGFNADSWATNPRVEIIGGLIQGFEFSGIFGILLIFSWIKTLEKCYLKVLIYAF
jgi:hypothetical protein